VCRNALLEVLCPLWTIYVVVYIGMVYILGEVLLKFRRNIIELVQYYKKLLGPLQLVSEPRFRLKRD